MSKEKIIKTLRDEVSKEFGAERIKDIEYFRPYEGGTSMCSFMLRGSMGVRMDWT